MAKDPSTIASISWAVNIFLGSLSKSKIDTRWASATNFNLLNANSLWSFKEMFYLGKKRGFLNNECHFSIFSGLSLNKSIFRFYATSGWYEVSAYTD